MEKKQGNKVVEGALSLTIATALVKVLGAIYKIPISYVLGEEGMGYFNSAYTIYSFFYLLCTAGVPKSIMIICGEANRKGKDEASIIGCALKFYIIVGMVISLAFALLSATLSKMIGSPESYKAMLFISPSIFLSSVSGVIRGYFSAKTKFVHIAVSQIIEGAGKLIFGLILSIVSSNLSLTLSTVSAFAILGATIGCLCSFIYLWYNIKSSKPSYKIKQNCSLRYNSHIIKALVTVSVPIAIGALVMSVTNIIDLAVIINRLKNIGYSSSVATALYGNYTTLALPIFNTIVSLFVPLTIAFMPSLINEKTNAKNFLNILQEEVNISCFIFVPLTLGIIVYSEELLILLFDDKGVFIGSQLLVYSMLSMFFLIPLSILNCAMEAQGKVNVTMISMIVGGIFKIIFGYALIGNTNFGIFGAPISTLAFYCVAFLTSSIIAYKKFQIILPILNYMAVSLINAFVSIFSVYVVYLYVSTKINWILAFVLATFLSILLYLVINIVEGNIKSKILLKLSTYRTPSKLFQKQNL